MPVVNYSLVAACLAAISAVTDLSWKRIPNGLTFSAIALGVGLHAVAGRASVEASLLGLVVAGGFPALLHRLTRGAAIGGGDVKLFAALGALLGPTLGLEVEFSSFVYLTAFALVQLTLAGQLLRVLESAARLAARPLLSAGRRTVHAEALTELRLGPAIFAATLTCVLASRLGNWLPWLS